MSALFFQTPLLYSRVFSERLGRNIFLKMECFQPSGSFKNRGIGRLVGYYAKQGKKGIVACSGGNAGLAAAYAARQFNLPAKVVIPKKAYPFMMDRIRKEHAEVIVHGDHWGEANEMALTIGEQNDYGYVSPFDHPEIWKGHASLVHEIAEQGVKPDAMVLSVGGGGLMNGVVHGLWEAGWNRTAVITTETEGASALAQSMASGKRVFLDHPRSVASSLCAPYISEETFRLTKEHPIVPFVVTDEDATSASVRFADDHRVLVEPACGAALAPLYQNAALLHEYGTIVVVVCGGNLVNAELIQEWRKTRVLSS